jgi:hypothetical protein
MRALRSRAAIAAILASSVAAAQTITFGDASQGRLPDDFEVRLTGGGPPPRWEVVTDATATDGKALAQLSADKTDLRFPLAVHRSIAAADVEVSTRFKAISGKVDQAGGLAVRLKDQNNYYVTRANALEDNVRFYRVVNGRRQQLASANVKVAPGEWHTLTLRAGGDRFTVSFDGKQLLDHRDRTFAEPGKVALWTKADSVTRFDRLTIQPLQ